MDSGRPLEEISGNPRAVMLGLPAILELLWADPAIAAFLADPFCGIYLDCFPKQALISLPLVHV